VSLWRGRRGCCTVDALPLLCALWVARWPAGVNSASVRHQRHADMWMTLHALLVTYAAACLAVVGGFCCSVVWCNYCHSHKVVWCNY